MSVFLDQGRSKEAGQECRAVLAAREHTLGPEHPDTLKSCYNLAVSMQDQPAKNHEARAYAQRAFAGRLKLFGKDHPLTQKSQCLMDKLAKPEAKTGDKARDKA